MSYPLLFAAGVHDVKNHLNTFLTELNEAYASGDLSRLPELSARCVEMAARLDQLLLFRKAEDGGVMAIPDTLSLSDMIEDSLLECQPIFNSRNVQVRMEGVDPLGILIRIDKTLLSVILNNLLYNASVWAQSTVMLSVETPAPGCVSIAVSDDGNGFPPELIGADLSNALGGDDQGLLNTLGTGLYLCAFSARAMTDANLPCTLALSNREDAGATVTIMLNNQPA